MVTGDVRIDNYRIETTLNYNKAIVDFNIEATGFLYQNKDLTAQFTLNDGNCDYICTAPITVSHGDKNRCRASIEITDPKLWWPYELGESFLHNLTIKILDGDKALDEICEKVGLRQITMAMNPGYTLDEVENPWTFVVNNKPMFLRSACWTQPSFLYGENSTAKYKFFLEKAKECGINNLRIFGWHPPETEDFYAICDQLGITVWTNFSFATQIFRDDRDYIAKVCNEAEEIVRDRRNHPSTIMWMGGEEVFFTEEHVKSNNRCLMETLGKVSKSLSNTPYADASPLSARYGVRIGYKPKECAHANSHYYAAGAVFMEDYYPQQDYAVIPELTAASAPNIESLKKFIPEDELWPLGPSWGYHWSDTHVLENLNYEVFGDMCLNSLEEFVDATQVAQGTILQFSLEHFRRQKPKCSVVSLCHFITNWPLIKWDIIDYYGNEKKSFDFVKACYNPFLASMQFDKRRYIPGETFTGNLYVINDYYTEYKNLSYKYSVLDKNQNVVHSGELTVSNVTENSAENFGKFEWVVTGNIGENFTVKLELCDEKGNIVSTNQYVILIADYEKSKIEYKNLLTRRHDSREKFGKRGYYGYTPDIFDRETFPKK